MHTPYHSSLRTLNKLGTTSRVRAFSSFHLPSKMMYLPISIPEDSRKRHPRKFPLLASHLVSLHVFNNMTEMQFSSAFHVHESSSNLSWSRERKPLKRPCMLPFPRSIRPDTGRCSTRAALAMQPRPQALQENM
jgi:hypothetical protein